jgi:hypothetical protein
MVDDGVFRYFGEGPLGDMKFERGNRAIRDHIQDGKVLLVFKLSLRAAFAAMMSVRRVPTRFRLEGLAPTKVVEHSTNSMTVVSLLASLTYY